MIKYLGSKRTLLPAILGIVQTIPKVATVADLFSGTSRVGHAFKGAGYRVISNDHTAYAHTLARCYVQADAERWQNSANTLLRELTSLRGRPGYFTHTFCHESRFFQPKNGERIDAIRERIARLDLPPELEAILLVSLMEAADRVDSTTGVQMAYLKNWAIRSHKDLNLRLPDILPGRGLALSMDAAAAAKSLRADVVYLDPPYNQHGYLRNYHIWESLVRWDKPETYGIARKRIDCKTRKSAFNSARGCLTAMQNIISTIDARHILVSFNNEGHIKREQMIQILQSRGRVETTEIAYPRYVGAKIGIYNPSGERVGAVSHTRNIEYLFHVHVGR